MFKRRCVLLLVALALLNFTGCGKVFFFAGTNDDGEVVISYFDKSELGNINGIWEIKQERL